MLLKSIKDIYHKELDGIYPREEVSAFFSLLTEHYLGLERFILVMKPDLIISKEEEAPLFMALSKLKEEYPVQYITGKAHFMDLELTVNEHTLVPRPETEELVQWILEDSHKAEATLRILDIGTGSGCIAIALSHRLQYASVTAVDISAAALEIAQENARAHGCNINFKQLNILEEQPEGQPWDVIVSNPPYVMDSEQEGMPVNVKKYEPHHALFVPDEDPLKFYRRITELAAAHLKEGGGLYFEINEALGDAMTELLSTHEFSEIQLRKDIFGKDRFIKGIK
ncbi:peptide chain release factor N(5)-glutamine methyltransferase [Zeaxanthinibacter enoshimensis]|uniref:peptide chain release factor N(5)-glutamine methyltransferase n=1 Tax=Zeaxanthinibacter enoshimensis TaxID=392009 RepID=UPI00356961BB